MKKIFSLFPLLFAACTVQPVITQSPTGNFPQPPVLYGKRIPSQEQFAQIVADVQKESFKDDKMKMLKVSTDFYPYFSADQLQQLVLLFNKVDDERLKTAKLLARKVVDKNNLPSLADLFFMSDKDKYLDFLQNMR